MSLLDAERKQMMRIVVILSKHYLLAELMGAACVFCKHQSAHSGECPVGLAWPLLDVELQMEARETMRADLANNSGGDWPDTL